MPTERELWQICRKTVPKYGDYRNDLEQNDDSI